MPKTTLHPILAEIRGTLFEDMVFKKTPSGKVIISKKPDMSRVRKSKAQLANQERFKQASDYATAAKANTQVWAKYERRAKRFKKRPRDLAISDFYKGKDLLKNAG